MANIILFDDATADHLLPLTYTRPSGMLRAGILTIAEKWEHRLGQPVSWLTREYLSVKYPLHVTADNLLINGTLVPDDTSFEAITRLPAGAALYAQGVLLALRTDSRDVASAITDGHFRETSLSHPVTMVTRPWHLFQFNHQFVADDFDLLTRGRHSAPLSDTNRVLNPSQVFAEPGAVAECAILNATTGPIYLAAGSEVMEGCMVRGPFSLGEHSTLKLGAKIYGATTIGPHCKVGGEVSNSILQGFSNKAHDGFLGNSVLGEWCNLGADTNNSNLKNNYAEVKLWSYPEGRFANTGLQFCGLIMGDHSKCGINTMFNTGTVVGVSANIFGDGFPRNFIPSFSWGGAQGFITYTVPKAFETIEKVMSRRGLPFSTTEQDMLRHVYDISAKYRK